MTRRRPNWLPILAALAAVSILFTPARGTAGLLPKLPPSLPAAFDKTAPEGLDDLKAMEALVDQCMADYDENGWRGATWLNPDDAAEDGAPARAAE